MCVDRGTKMGMYNYHSKNVRSYLQGLYDSGLQKSKYLNDTEILEIISTIGIFKFKGYYYAFKHNIVNHTIDDILIVYYFDKYLTRIIMDLTSTIETKLKAILVELCYEKIRNFPPGHPSKNNPFFYLLAANYKIPDFKINNVTVSNWKRDRHSNQVETYSHYGLYYKNKYDFATNRSSSLSGQTLIPLYDDINYPPFHYIVEGATLGGIIGFIKQLKIEHYDVLRGVSSHFGVVNARAFKPYLERLNEVRNRAAHRERIFNRSYRSISRSGKFKELSVGFEEHKMIDVYLYFFFMLGRLDEYDDMESFEKEEIERLFVGFKEDYFLNKDSKGLIGKISSETFANIKKFILVGMK